MPVLDFGDSGATGPSTKKPFKLFLGAGVLVGALTLGSTFAANINLNGGGNVEFGQGVATTTACDEDGITVTPFSTFINEPGAGAHKLTTIRISGIDSTSCDGKTFRIKAYGDGPDPLELFKWEDGQTICNADTCEIVYTERDRYDFVDITRTGGDYIWTSEGSDDDDVIDRTSTAFTMDFVSASVEVRRTPLALAGDVKKITVETFDASEAEGGYALGDTGPGGGVIFYVANEPFVCGYQLNETCQYLEVAPYGWYDNGPDPSRTWSAEANWATSVEGAGGTAIGTGYANSVAISSQGDNIASNSAAVLAREHSGGNQVDWYLPSRGELDQLHVYNQFAGVGGYWSSSQVGGSEAWDQGQNGFQGEAQKSSQTPVRPIRAF
jgi:hypothetical protein